MNNELQTNHLIVESNIKINKGINKLLIRANSQCWSTLEAIELKTKFLILSSVTTTQWI